MKVLVVLALCVSSASFAQALDVTTPLKAPAKTPEELVASPDFSLSRLEALRSGTKPFLATDLQTIRTKALNNEKAKGGDDVGNGGDEVRQEFIGQARQMLDEVPASALKDQLLRVLSIRHLVVSRDLSLRSETELMPMKSYVSEGIIFLDAKAWDPQAGLLSHTHDPRYEMLKMLAQAAGAPKTGVSEMWHGLSARNAPIWCPFNQSKMSIVRSSREFKVNHDSSVEAQRLAMSQCSEARLSDCRISEIIRKGTFSGWVSVATAKGWSESFKPKTNKDLAQERCAAIHACEAVHEWAPKGQVRPSDFQRLESEAAKVCR